MLDPKIIRDKPELIKEMLKDRAIDFDLEKMLELNKVRKEMMQQSDELKQKRNQMSTKLLLRKKQVMTLQNYYNKCLRFQLN